MKNYILLLVLLFISFFSYSQIGDFQGNLNISTPSGLQKVTLKKQFNPSTLKYSSEIELFGALNRTIKIDGQSSNTNDNSSAAITLYDHLTNEGLKLFSNSGDGGKLELFNTSTSNLVMNLLAGETGHGIIQMYNDTGERTIKIDGQAGNRIDGAIHLFDGTGSTTSKIQMEANWGGLGNSRISTDELQINGGSDFSENFEVIKTNNIEPQAGMIVSIDPNHNGKLALSNCAHDKKIVGIISGANGVNPGIYMSQSETIADGDYPVALTGRVYVKSNELGGKIIPGCFLTSSSVCGEAMRAKSLRKSKGSIIGKALSSVDKNGFVLVLVNLQ